MKAIVLVRPSGPRNVGSIVRAAANFGPAEIRLVNPQRASLLEHPDFEQMSHGVDDARGRCAVFDDLPAALLDCTHAVGFTSRAHRHRVVESFRTRVPELAARGGDNGERVALVFGAEVNGMSSEETAACHELCHLETSDDHGSLNLSMAVTVVLHALFSVDDPKELVTRRQALSGSDRAFLKARVGETLGSKMWTPAAAADLRQSVERLFGHAPLEARDARAWHMLLRALGSEHTPADLGERGLEKP